MERISSRRNPLVQRFRALAREGRSGDDVLLDGEHLVREALASGIHLEAVAIGEHARRRLEPLAARAAATGARIFVTDDPVLHALSPVRQPSGVVAIARCAPVPLRRLLDREPQLVLIVSAVQDPGNIGAIIRTAEAGGASGLIAGARTADPFGWKALRGSMGSAFRLPISVKQPVAQAVAAARAAGLRIYAATPRDGTPLPACRLQAPAAILLGGEGTGLDSDLVGSADERLTVPMHPPVESLNVAIAAALILYEASRQRNSHVAVR